MADLLCQNGGLRYNSALKMVMSLEAFDILTHVEVHKD